MRDRFVRSMMVVLACAALAVTGCPGDNGANGTSCTVTQDETTGIATIECDDGTSAEVANGATGEDGETCTLDETPNGKVITCGDTTIPVADGTSCTVDDNPDGSQTITCDDGSEAIVDDGVAGDSCTLDVADDGTKMITCGDETIIVTDGADGLDGLDGDSCTVTDNDDGTRTIDCEDGSSVTVADGEDGMDIGITSLHGSGFLTSTGEFAEGKFMANAVITDATADEDGLVTVDFTVTDEDGEPWEGLTSISANIDSLIPADDDNPVSRWVPYIYRTQTVDSEGSWPAPIGTSAQQAYRENTGTLTNNGDGQYTYVFATNISTATFNDEPLDYIRSRTHRVSIMMGGHSGATASPHFDFVPDGSEVTETRNIVQTSTCKHCHGEEFHGHGGDRVTVETCATCHIPGNVDPHGSDGADFPGESLDLKVMIHKIHSGGELATIPGEDGLVWDDPATVADESEDNGRYAIWGNRNNMNEWWQVGFPAIIENCTACHQGDGEQVNNWRENPSRAACGSCHDDVSFEPGTTTHPGGDVDNDDDCTLCHKAETDSIAPSITNAHAWIEHDPRKQPEFDVSLSVDTPERGYYIDGESPIVTLILTDRETGEPIDHAAAGIGDDSTAEGCTLVDADEDGEWDECPQRDGLFKTAALFVHGPRARRVPVLTTAARAQIFSSTTGPFDLGALANNAAALILKVDQGQNIHSTDVAGGDVLLSGTITVNMLDASFANKATATVDELVAWLNANTSFAARAIAYKQSDKLGIRSRNLGTFHALQLQASSVATVVFANDTAVKTPTGSTAGNNVLSRTSAANNDPKAVRVAGSVTYYLDPVDDLQPGTYIVKVEIADAGNTSDTNFRSPSVHKITFQVGTAEEEPFVARNCSTCHESPEGIGFVLDWRRHAKRFEDSALDTCGNCHDYQPQNATSATGAGTWGWTGAKPISRRVHAVHFGSSLNYPLGTVDYQNGDPIKGRAWNITFPQDVRNCEVCHTAETSGTWATRPARLPCSGCHDSDAAMAHMRAQTFDPTPLDPWSGDEQESCQACH